MITIDFDRMIDPEKRLVWVSDTHVVAHPVWAEQIYAAFEASKDEEGFLVVKSDREQLDGALAGKSYRYMTSSK